MLERESPVTGEVVGVRVRLHGPDDPDAPPLRLLEILLDRERGVDDDCFPRPRIADEIGRAAERVVDELREDHNSRP